MLTIEECKSHLGSANLSDAGIARVRGLLYVLVENALDYMTDTGTFVCCQPLAQVCGKPRTTDAEQKSEH